MPALSYFGQQVWGSVVDDLAAGQGRKYFLLGGKVSPIWLHCGLNSANVLLIGALDRAMAASASCWAARWGLGG